MKFFRVMLLILVAFWLLPAEAEASSTGQPKEPALRMKVDLSSAGPGEVYSSFSQDGYTVMITHPNVDAATQQILGDKNLDVVEVYMETYNKSLAATKFERACYDAAIFYFYERNADNRSAEVIYDGPNEYNSIDSQISLRYPQYVSEFDGAGSKKHAYASSWSGWESYTTWGYGGGGGNKDFVYSATSLSLGNEHDRERLKNSADGYAALDSRKCSLEENLELVCYIDKVGYEWDTLKRMVDQQYFWRFGNSGNGDTYEKIRRIYNSSREDYLVLVGKIGVCYFWTKDYESFWHL